MALPKTKKKIIPDINAAVQRAAGQENTVQSAPPSLLHKPHSSTSKKTGRPSPRPGNAVRQTLLLTEETAERLTMAYAVEQIRRRKEGEQLDKSLFIEEMIVSWLDRQSR